VSMTKIKPVTPYQRLLDDCRRYLSTVRFPTRKKLWTYPKANLDGQWDLGRLWERAAAADLLGYDTVLKSTDEGLVVEFRARPDENKLPWSLK
jgi:hypothetical protein